LTCGEDKGGLKKSVSWGDDLERANRLGLGAGELFLGGFRLSFQKPNKFFCGIRTAFGMKKLLPMNTWGAGGASKSGRLLDFASFLVYLQLLPLFFYVKNEESVLNTEVALNGGTSGSGGDCQLQDIVFGQESGNGKEKVSLRS
jgi:hypothetical protein